MDNNCHEQLYSVALICTSMLPIQEINENIFGLNAFS